MSQTSYSQRLTRGVAGELTSPLQESKLDSKINALAMPAGVWVARDGADDAVKVPAAAGDVTTTGCGFTKHDVARSRPANGSVDYDALEGVTVMRAGRMLVLCETAAAYGGAVFARITASGGNTQLGKVRNDADTANATAVPGARFIGTITAAGLVEIELLGSGSTGATGATGATGP